MLDMSALVGSTSSTPSRKTSPGSPIALSSRPLGTLQDQLQYTIPSHPHISEPSPIESTRTASTGGTEIEGHSQEHQDKQAEGGHGNCISQHDTHHIGRRTDASPVKIDTTFVYATEAASDFDAAPQSVIHASDAFGKYDNLLNGASWCSEGRRSPAERSARTVISPKSSPSASTSTSAGKSLSAPQRTVPSIVVLDRPGNTSKPQSMAQPHDVSSPSRRHEDLEHETLKALTWEQAEHKGHTQRRRSIQLTDVSPAQHFPGQHIEDDMQSPPSVSIRPTGDLDHTEHSVDDITAGFSQCWTLCNTLAQLSAQHRKRVFQQTAYPDIQEQAWTSCWKLCQSLYQNRDGSQCDYVLSTLDMCREFCQALFEARHKPEEGPDSVLRVLWELQNHLYNTHDRQLPIAFQERTLEFYITLLHRLMKQRTSLPEETEALLRACWDLAEILFVIRQESRTGKSADEEHLSMAIQACWELCDLFRRGWTQVRPERSTPRPNQTGFSLAQAPFKGSFSGRSARSDSRTSDNIQQQRGAYSHAPQAVPPETPTTIFDDNPLDTFDDNIPNILVLGPGKQTSRSSKHWSSSASSYSESSGYQTSATATAKDSVMAHLSDIRVLLVKAAMSVGFQTPGSPNLSISNSSTESGLQKQRFQQQRDQALYTFVKVMPSNSFGVQPWQVSLVEKFSKLLASWPAFVSSLSGGNAPSETLLLIPEGGSRRNVAHVANSVQWLARIEQYVWLRDLFRMVFGYFPDDTEAAMDESYVQV